MNISKVHFIYFSPTTTSKQVGEAIVHGIGLEDVVTTDLTLRAAEVEVDSHTLALIVVPVYSGRVAPLAMERLQGIRSSGGPAIVVVVYGNRAYAKSLAELDAFATDHGFKVIAGGTFIGEHSYCDDFNSIAEGRPDKYDDRFANSFGGKVRSKIETAPDMEHLYPVNVNRIQRPRQPLLPMLKFIWKVKKLRKSGVPLPSIPQSNEKKCRHCGSCVEHCPTGAITAGDECHTDATKCIKCCACVKECSYSARKFETPIAKLLAECFEQQKKPQIIV